MKIRIFVAVLALTSIWVGAWGQCKKPEINPIWDSSKNQFRCVDPAAAAGSDHDESVSPTGTKESCAAVRENLLKICPTSDEGKICKGKAKSIFNACYKGSKNGAEDHNASTNTQGQIGRTDPSTCMATYNQQQRACASRRQPPPSPGQPYVPDTCLQDALVAQNKCLANSH
jgi:hypothetical protein